MERAREEAVKSPNAVEMPSAPTYVPLGGDDHVPLFQAKPKTYIKFGFTDRTSELTDDLRAQSALRRRDILQAEERESDGRRFTLHPHQAYAGYQLEGSDRSWNDKHQSQYFAGCQRAPWSRMPQQQRPASPEFPDSEMERRLRRIEGMVERMSDVQGVQVRAEYERSCEKRVKAREAEAMARATNQEEEESSDSESEAGEWTVQDGQDLWRSTKERKKRNPFEHGVKHDQPQGLLQRVPRCWLAINNNKA